MKIFNLILDVDGIIFNSLPLIDEEVRKINYTASDKFYNKVRMVEVELNKRYRDLEYERANNLSEVTYEYFNHEERIATLIKHHFEMKDRVLEEVDPKFRNRIDYSKVYKLENTYPGVVKTIQRLYASGAFGKIYALSHVNSLAEIEAKKEFFSTYLPMIEFIPVLFHQDPFYIPGTMEKNPKRIRTNKICYFKSQLGIDNLEDYFFVDDTKTIVDEAREEGVGYCYYKTSDLDINNILDDLANISFSKMFRKKR